MPNENKAAKFRAACMEDLPQLYTMYQNIIRRLDEEKIQIWDDVYPCMCFRDDIAQGHMYVLEENGELAVAFALCPTDAGSEHMNWENNAASALYLERLGVDVRYLRRGLGSVALAKVIELAKEQGAEYVRLFVVDFNEPAIKLYERGGFQKTDGIYIKDMGDGFLLREYGFEYNCKRKKRL